MKRSIVLVTVVAGAALAALAGCQGAFADSTPPPGKAVAVAVSIASATLADDCAPPPAASGTTSGAARRDMPGDEAVTERSGRRACRQSSVQLSLAPGAEGAASPFTVVKAQLFDAANGALIGDMKTRNPQVWLSDAGSYRPWDTVVKPKQKLQVSYDMNAPNWSKMGGSQMAAQGKSFRLVMTVRVAGKDIKVESTVRSAELMIEPHVVT